jgi:hypothetical protein
MRQRPGGSWALAKRNAARNCFPAASGIMSRP